MNTMLEYGGKIKISEDVYIPRSILIDHRSFTFQERLFIYFWASRALDNKFYFTYQQYMSFRDFPDISGRNNLRTLLKRMKQRELLDYSKFEDGYVVTFDQSFSMSDPLLFKFKASTINSLSILQLRLLEIIYVMSSYSFCFSISLVRLLNLLGVGCKADSTAIRYFHSVVKPSLIKLSNIDTMRIKCEMLDGMVKIYVLKLD